LDAPERSQEKISVWAGELRDLKQGSKLKGEDRFRWYQGETLREESVGSRCFNGKKKEASKAFKAVDRGDSTADGLLPSRAETEGKKDQFCGW